MKATEIIAALATKAQAHDTNGAWVTVETEAGIVSACSVKKHFGGNPFASYSTNYRLNGKRIALSKLINVLDAKP